ncbi:ribosome silencing factor [Gudongella sp. SC589]|jgi:ribosome-associated protein|uniref:ribosome silencing factor n=1 Tax=Gudongella sp. SC589 TaxID=3385990 RepID=UPI003904E181
MTELNKKLEIIQKAIDDKKGFNIETMEVGKLTTIADYFVIASGNSSNQVTSIADEVEDKMEEAGFHTLTTKEGYGSARWIILDYEDVIVHLFHRDEREYYNLERLWSEYEKISKEEK